MSDFAQMACPEPDQWSALADPHLRGALEAHLDTCAECCELVAALAGEPAVPSPDRVGRYEIRGTLGTGGMGVVLLGFDAQLERTVALKLVRDGRRSNLVDEAKAMAKITHPNVVTVHEIVDDGEEQFIVMERVDGADLATWLLADPRSPADRFAMVLDTARGIAAVHAAGLVHRDIKPTNILVGRDGRARVTDLGLAGAHGRAVGTPGYIAPEGTSDACADQYAFAITAQQALGKPAARIARVLDKARAARREDRYPDMAAVVDALERTQRRRWPWLALPAAIAIIALVIPRDHAATCMDDPSVGGTWSPAQRAVAIGAWSTRDATPDHRLTTDLATLVDQRGAGWSSAVVDVCRAHERGADVAIARGSCLEDERKSLATTLASGQSPDALLSTIAHLPTAAACEHPTPADPKVHETYKKADTAARAGDLDGALVLAREAVRLAELAHDDHGRVRAMIVLLGILDDAGHTSETKTVAPLLAAVAGAQTLEPADRARVENALGNASQTYGDYTDAEHHYRAAVAADEKAYAGAPAPEIAGNLANLASVMHAQGKVKEARELLASSIAMFEKARGPNAADLALFLSEQATLEMEASNYVEASKLLERTIAIREQALGPEHPYLAESIEHLARAQMDLGHEPRAIELYRRAIAIATKGFGADHPLTAVAQGRLAEILEDRGEHAEARALVAAAVATWDASGVAMPDAHDARFALARLAWIDGDHVRARKLAQAALAGYSAMAPAYVRFGAPIAKWLKDHP